MMISSTSRRMMAVAAAFAITTAGLSACSTSADADAKSATEGGTLVFSNWQWLEPGRGEVMWEAVNGYVTDNPKAELVKSETAFAQYADKLNTQLGAGSGPDVFVIGDSQFVTLAEAGLLEPLNSSVSGVKLNASNDSMVLEGDQLGVTWDQVSYALLGNKIVMEQAGLTQMPTTVDELIAASKAIEANGADGFAVRHQMNDFGGWYFDFQAWPYGQGGAWSDGEKLTIDSPANVKGVSEFKRVMEAGIVPIGDDASTFRTKFKENQLGFTIDNSGAAASFASGGKLTGADILSAPLPFPFSGQNEHLILAVNANSKNKELAKNFVSWVVSESGQSALRPSMGASTMATNIPLEQEFETANPWAATYLENGSKSRSVLIPGFETETVPIMRIIMQAVERVIAEGQDPQAALSQAQQEAEAAN
ncbi:sugar ABC transporter substrate-binding protein [Alpinimonas psychrophila]|uniref:Multiple sugar transport system substrate-binding protein n=1 Tax=Alpinimonas psychrophila TaxID=748908 RepID=A0A7W3JTL2_9MICO|nr:extracellular solute-binding protein [Alpinimonas psychrophila]MBA8829029.1 multiple sugar transport system substrate-binding protein [Alpinimonas psychrophila]